MLTTFKTSRYIPEGAQEIRHPRQLGVAYLTQKPDSPACTVIAYRCKAIRPAFHYRFQTTRRANEYIEQFFASLTRHEDLKRQRREEQKKPHTLQVGQIIVSTWGYDQTNVDFYEIVAVTQRTVDLRPIASEPVPGSEGFMSDRRIPKPGQYVGEKTRKAVRKMNGTSFVSFRFGTGRPWNGEPQYCSWYA